MVNQRGQGASFEQQESIDDSLLPEATELAKLKELDGEVITWIKSRTEKEQDARLDFNARKMTLIEKAQRKAFTIDIVAISAAFLIVMSGMVFSYFMIQKDLVIQGSLFAGATIFLAANSFLNFRKRQSAEKKTNT